MIQISTFTALALTASAAIVASFTPVSAFDTQVQKSTETASATTLDATDSPKRADDDGSRDTSGEWTDKPIAAHRAELLTLAFEAASSLPTHPHVKNRCRMQEDVITTCLELEQPRRALSYIEKIDNWRRGSTYADLALYLARHENAQHVSRFLELADQVAERKTEASNQEWRIDLIKAKIAAVLVATTAEKEIVDFKARVPELDAMVYHGGLEETTRALSEYAKLYDEHYADETRRNMLYTKVRKGWGNTPIQVRFESLSKLTETALAHDDRPTALVLAREAREVLAAADFVAEDRIPLIARSAALFRRAGDPDSSKKELDAAIALYDKHEKDIVDIYRSTALRALAEQYQELGDGDRALTLYSRAVEAGVVNPNSRPRADDLMAVCCSMARCDVQPTEPLMKRLREVRANLREPW
ncbi:MAG: hypothetical protein SGI72_09810 [Planctomycetota bacterium]|nr:hypothetical protein [Planctomycetota bacterium]